MQSSYLYYESTTKIMFYFLVLVVTITAVTTIKNKIIKRECEQWLHIHVQYTL